MNTIKNFIDKNIINKNTIEVFMFYCKMLNPFKIHGKLILCVSLDNYDYIYELKKHNTVIIISDVYNIFNDYTFNSFEEFVNILIKIMKKFDYIIMNPPYQGNLHLQILAKAITYLKDNDSKCVNLSPIIWIQDALAKYKKNSAYFEYKNSILSHTSNIEIIPNNIANALFNIAGGDLGIYQTHKNSTSIYNFSHISHASSISRKTMEYILDNDNNSIRNHVQFNDNTKHEYNAPILDIYGGKISGSSFIKELTYKSRSKFHAWVGFNSNDEVNNFIYASRTNFFKYLMVYHKMGVHYYYGKYFPFMHDYTEPWTDERFYKFFDITEEEQKIIEETIAKYE